MCKRVIHNQKREKRREKNNEKEKKLASGTTVNFYSMLYTTKYIVHVQYMGIISYTIYENHLYIENIILDTYMYDVSDI